MTDLSARHHAGLGRRPLRALVLGGTLVVGMSLGVVLVHAYDQRLDEALGALEKAAALVDASSAGNVSPRTQRRFDRHLDKARANIQNAMDHIAAAGAIADSDDGGQ
jgi:hypothetical protein